MSPLLRGSGGTQSEEGQLKGLADFIKTAKDASLDDKKNFQAALTAQRDKKYKDAKRFYNELQQVDNGKYNDNTIIKANLKLFEKNV